MEGAEGTCRGPDRAGVLLRNRRNIYFAWRIHRGRRNGVREDQEVRKGQIIIRECNLDFFLKSGKWREDSKQDSDLNQPDFYTGSS